VTKVKIFLAASIIILSSLNLHALKTSNSANCQRDVDKFLNHPNKSKLEAFSKHDDSRCLEVIATSNDDLNRLNNETAKGNPWAAQYLAGTLKMLDGGNLEDALVALGQFSEHNMQRFLSFANEGILSDDALRDALTMLPLSLTDDPQAQLRALSLRRRHAMSVNRNDLQQQRAEALKAIDDFAAEVRSKSNR
jgi:hypothetical protein